MITITDSAAEYIRRETASKDKSFPRIRLGVRGGGCTGFSYLMEWSVDVPQETDKIFTNGEVEVVVDPKSYVYLRGTELAFERGLMGHGLKINNPNVKNSCGCGESINF